MNDAAEKIRDLLTMVEKLEKERDAFLEVCAKLARLRAGPTPSRRGPWINGILALAEEAREALIRAK